MGEIKVSVDIENARARFLSETREYAATPIRRRIVDVLVDTGAVMLMLPQDLVEELGLRITGKVLVTYADERREERPVADLVTVTIGNRSTTVDCIVGPPTSEPLLGQLILERLDLIADCTRHQLARRPESPFLPLLKVK